MLDGAKAGSGENAPYSDRAINILTVLWGYLVEKLTVSKIEEAIWELVQGGGFVEKEVVGCSKMR